MRSFDVEERLEQIRDAGAHPTRFRPLVGLARRILWPLIRPYHRRQLELTGDPGDADSRQWLARDVAALRGEIRAVVNRMARMEFGEETGDRDAAEPGAPGNRSPNRVPETDPRRTASPGRTSYAQSGEDLVVEFVLERLGVAGEEVAYADLGSALPDGHNNTYLLYRRGGRGLLVEADPDYRRDYATLRPEDEVLCVAVVPDRLRSEGTIRFHLCHDQGWSSVLPEHIDKAARLGKGGLRKTIVAETRTINEVLDRFADRDLHVLSVDVEGLDEELMEELDFTRVRPWILIVEDMHGRDGRLASLLDERGYEHYASTYINSIWLDRAVLERLKTRL